MAPGRWVFHSSPGRGATRTNASYPMGFESVYCPPVPCKALWFFYHSSGHAAYSKEAFLSSHANKEPDWKGSRPLMRDGWYEGADGCRKAQPMHFLEGDMLPCNITTPVGLDLDVATAATDTNTAADTAANTAADDADLPPPPPTEAESVSAFKLYHSGKSQTLKRKHPGLPPADIKEAAWALWQALGSEAQMVYVSRCRAKVNGETAATAKERLLVAGSPVPRALWGRHKGMECILSERCLYPAAGLKGACQSEKKHSAANDCCCARLLSVQPDFASECSALQHLIEERISLGLEMEGRRLGTTYRHLCIFLPKFHCELNWIERLWGASKAYTRRHCLYTLPGSRETVPLSLTQNLSEVPAHLAGRMDLPVSPLFLQRRWARISRQFMAEYRKGANGAEAIQGVKNQRSSKRHRDPNNCRSRAEEARMAFGAC